MRLDDAAIERLVDKARSGDVSAFGQLFDHFHLPIYRYIVSRVQSPADTEDLTQLVFVKAGIDTQGARQAIQPSGAAISRGIARCPGR